MPSYSIFLSLLLPRKLQNRIIYSRKALNLEFCFNYSHLHMFYEPHLVMYSQSSNIDMVDYLIAQVIRSEVAKIGG